ncbi:EAL domain-containing protein [Stenotrophomonas sp. W1S232]|uniref:EAL domain-containing protein n=1 Tax=Stenotrophomonas koreensis TaxID=266128 RepID=A0A7W3UZB8_9GAMM|nr:bifunctional diguanylate cyclase/phosphodiesterase [Stenotrophomonas koreensis]MBB1116668.1 EAL domain-containing protein [Stenotrophomonas koreensis]
MSESAPAALPATLLSLQQALQQLCAAQPQVDVLPLQQLWALLQQQVSELQRQLHDQRAIFDALPDPVCLLDEQGTVLDLNQAGTLAYQRSRQGVVGRPIHLLNPDLPPDHLQPVWDELNRGHSYQVEVTNMRSDGSRFPVEVHSAAVRLSQQRCIVAVARQLTGRWQAESHYRLLMESIDKGVLLFDRQLRICSANPAAHRILGLENLPRQPAGDHDHHWMTIDEHGRQLSREQWPVCQAFRDGRIIPSTVIGLHQPHSDRLVWLSVTNVPIFDQGQDRPQYVYALFSDITDLKRDATLFERAQSLAHIGGWEWDRSTSRLYLTREAQHILGRQPPPEDMQALLDCLLPASQQLLRDALEHPQQPGFEIELQGLGADGRCFWIRMIGETVAGQRQAHRLVGTLQDVTERHRAEEMLRLQARTDPLTGVLNRDGLLEELARRLHQGQRCAALYIDLDHFKLINDVLGHSAGDQLLCLAATRMMTAIGNRGLLGRLGGDEFLVICATENGHELPEQLARALVASFTPAFAFGPQRFTVTASIGIACSPGHGDTAAQLVQNADVAMYDCKKTSRNGWCLFNQGMAQRQQDRLQIESRLRQALEQQAFGLVYQPKVDLRDGRIIGAEALMRWEHEQLGQLRPDLFIEHAENTGDIVRIGNWVLEQACLQIRQWRDQGLGLLPVAVNVSYRQFAGNELLAQVQSALNRHQLPGHALELEFTERVLIEDVPATTACLNALRRLGVRLSIDDFGQGYSALNYLRRLPIHGLKISPLFIAGIPENRSDMAVCDAIVGIARSLELAVVAEGIETAAQRDCLLQLGVSHGQGFLFAAGLSADRLGARLRQQCSTPGPDRE